MCNKKIEGITIDTPFLINRNYIEVLVSYMQIVIIYMVNYLTHKFLKIFILSSKHHILKISSNKLSIYIVVILDSNKFFSTSFLLKCNEVNIKYIIFNNFTNKYS